MLKRYLIRINYHNYAPFAENVDDRSDRTSTDGVEWVLAEDIEPLLKRLAELEAKEQKREQFERECG